MRLEASTGKVIISYELVTGCLQNWKEPCPNIIKCSTVTFYLTFFLPGTQSIFKTSRTVSCSLEWFVHGFLSKKFTANILRR